ncbi:MAG: hypothetical protein WA144_08460 [Candidatus Methanoperedens sp.]
MIVRLMGEGQYELDKKHMDEVNKIDNNIVKILQKGDELVFKSEFKKLADYVKKNGKKISDEVIKPSEIIIPPYDLTLDEAKRIFAGDGLFPD